MTIVDSYDICRYDPYWVISHNEDLTQGWGPKLLSCHIRSILSSVHRPSDKGNYIVNYSLLIFTSPPIGGGRGIVMPMSVCVFVCLFVCLCVCLSVFSQNFKV